MPERIIPATGESRAGKNFTMAVMLQNGDCEAARFQSVRKIPQVKQAFG